MSTKVIIVWLTLLTAWIAFDSIDQHKNIQVRKTQLTIRNQKFENIEANFKRLDKFLNGPLKDELNEIKKYLHKH